MILIAVPTFENIKPECFRAIYNLKGDDTTFDYVKGYDCAKARNEIVRKALDTGADYVLMVDGDIICPPDALIKMLEYPADIVFGVYPRKTAPNETEIFYKGTFCFEKRYTIEELDAITAPRIDVKGSGFGCALIRTALFEEMSYPWFNFLSYDNGSFLSEDLYFCMMAEGHSIQVDTRVRCGHIGQTIF